VIADADRVLSSLIDGPDRRSQIAAQTHQVLFPVYAPFGIAWKAVRTHLEDIRGYAPIVTPEADGVELDVYG